MRPREGDPSRELLTRSDLVLHNKSDIGKCSEYWLRQLPQRFSRQRVRPATRMEDYAGINSASKRHRITHRERTLEQEPDGRAGAWSGSGGLKKSRGKEI